MGFLSSLFGNDDDHTQYFLPTTGPGSMHLEGHYISYRHTPNASPTRFSVDHIHCVYAEIDYDQQLLLYIYTNREHRLHAHFHGFRELYQTLSEQLELDDRAFFAFIKRGDKRTKQLLWRKKGETTYQLLPGQFDDYFRGFEVQSPQKKFISWDIAYDELMKAEPPLVAPDAEVDTRLNFMYPVRVGSVLFHSFYTFSTNQRTDIAIFRYFADGVHETSSDHSFHELKAHLQQATPANIQPTAYQDDDYARFAIKAEGMSISLGYSYDTDWHYERGFTAFCAMNEREYPSLLVDPAYEATMEISEFLLIDADIKIQSSYKRNSHVKRRPPLINQIDSKQAVIWKDHRHQKIGFAGAAYSETFSTDAIQSVTLQNILPAKGGGGAYLMLQLDEGQHPYTVFYGACHTLDPYRHEIATITGQELIVLPEYHDC